MRILIIYVVITIRREKVSNYMVKKNCKSQNAEFNHGNDKFDMEAAKELGINMSNKESNFTTAKIINAYELGLRDRI